MVFIANLKISIRKRYKILIIYDGILIIIKVYTWIPILI